MIIGNFRFDPAADSYTGEIRTLHIQRERVVLRPLKRLSDREPDYRVVQHGEGGTVELGAAWARKTERGQSYLSVLLDDPALAQPLSVALFPSEDDTAATLVWTRAPRKDRVAAAQPAEGSRRGRAARPAAQPG